MSANDISLPRRLWVKKLLEILRNIDPKSYFVKRGGISISSYDFTKKPRVFAVRCAENFPPDSTGVRQTTLEIQAFCKVDGTDEQADDDVLDELEVHALAAMQALRGVKTANGKDNLVTSQEFLGSVELNGAEYGIQGWYLTFRVEY